MCAHQESLVAPSGVEPETPLRAADFKSAASAYSAKGPSTLHSGDPPGIAAAAWYSHLPVREALRRGLPCRYAPGCRTTVAALVSDPQPQLDEPSRDAAFVLRRVPYHVRDKDGRLDC